MTTFRAATFAVLLCLLQQSTSFIPGTNIVAKHADLMTCAMSSDGSEQEDPTKSFAANIADAVQNALTNSPLNDAKKALVKSLAGNYDAVAVRARLEGLISEKPVLFLSFRTCPFCLKAKAILDEKKAQYHVVELDEVDDGKAIRAELANMVGRTSVPAIWIAGDFIGGCNDGPKGGIVNVYNNGELDKLLRNAGAV